MATQYGTATAITVTASTLANAAARQSTAVTSGVTNNTADYRVYVKATPNGAPTGNHKAVYIWVVTSENGTDYTGNATGSDAAITLDSPNQFAFGTAIALSATSSARGASFSLKAACGGSIPAKWAIVVENQCGVALSAFSAIYREEYNS